MEAITLARNKNSNDTKNEIIEIATDLFVHKGYDDTTIEDIFKNWGGSKGSLYYHFKSKEEILNAVVNTLVENEEKRIKEILSKENRNALDLLTLFLVACLDRPKQLYGLEVGIYQTKNITLFYRIAKLYIEKSMPILEPIILQGIDEGIFKVEYPAEAIELALMLEELAFKYPMFECNHEQFIRKISAFQLMLELTLGLEKDSLNQLSIFLSKNIQRRTHNGV